MLTLREDARGTVLLVLASPRAGKTAAEGVTDGALRVRIAAPPVEGAANEALERYLAEALDVPRRNVEVISGKRGRRKSVLVRGLSAGEVEERLRGRVEK
jgi:uncharacterized protein (TIGR00251 family)